MTGLALAFHGWEMVYRDAVARLLRCGSVLARRHCGLYGVADLRLPPRGAGTSDRRQDASKDHHL